MYVRALHAVGRTAEAIDRFMQISNRLAEELGVGPGAELSRAHQAVLGEAPTMPVVTVHPPPPPAPAAPAGVPAQLPADVRGFVGRRAVLEHLDALLTDSATQPTAPPIALVRGTAGVGKPNPGI